MIKESYKNKLISCIRLLKRKMFRKNNFYKLKHNMILIMNNCKKNVFSLKNKHKIQIMNNYNLNFNKKIKL